MEAPSHLKKVAAELKAFDKRLSISWNRDRNLWEVREKGARTGISHHVFFWAGGRCPNYTYRELPDTAKPLLDRLSEIDTMRFGERYKIEDLLRKGVSLSRAQKIERRNRDWKERLREYAGYMTASKFKRLDRNVQMGGAAGKQAVADRTKAIREILIPEEGESKETPA